MIVKEDSTLMEYLLKSYSRKHVKNYLKFKEVSVNGENISQFDYPLHQGDKVEITKNNLNTNLDIIYEDDEIIVINKPHGLLSVETDNRKDKTAYSYVSDYLHRKNEKAYTIHRLDRETSGVLLFAKTNKMKALLQNNWNDIVVDREYLAIVEGIMPKKQDRIINYLKENKAQKVYVSDEGKKCITSYKVLKQNKHTSLLEVNIETGRKNQIRATLADLKHPIVGDKKYGSTNNSLKRLGLHASKLSYKHPINHKLYSFEAKAEKEFKIK
ncbi:MAG: RluA family pseudouridine synthase [Thomasclavelia sp.]|jgi:23S rRNA pseudouridine1911/1915/1917 synthase|nr:RluA family pseudouridine synthase [Thomasclavelia sp.]